MASRPPPASTPIHPRLLELAAQAGDSPFSTPDSVVTASSVDKTRQTEESQVSEDQSTSHDSSGESLGIRAARPHSSGFIDAGMSPPGTTSDSESSKTENMDGKHDSNDVSSSFGEHSAQACGSAHASQANTAGVAQTDSPPSAAADQSEDRLHQDHDHAGEKAGQSGAADSPDNHLTNLVKDPSSISGSKNRVVKFYSPPPPSLSSASLKRGDYYSDSATLNLPSPRLEPILEASTELSAGYKAAMMAETPLKQASSMRQTATVNRRLTCVFRQIVVISCHRDA